VTLTIAAATCRSAIDEHRADDQHTFPITLFGRADEVIE
jgi:hypothetical protein